MQVTPQQAESFTDTIKEAVKKTESTVLDFLIDNNLISNDALNKYTDLKYGDTGYDPNVKNTSPIFERALETPERDSKRISKIEMRERGSEIPDRPELNKGGMPKQMQMAFMDDGGLKDEGGETDPESGNEVPFGSLKEEVRDDLPTMLSEGEFVFPADVVRYIGLEKLMMMRQEAKMGLKRMEAMGQMGNSDEATMPDDLPFGITDLIVVGGSDVEPKKMQTGGLNTSNFRTLTSPQEVPIREGRRNVALPDISDLIAAPEEKEEETTDPVVEPVAPTTPPSDAMNIQDRGFGKTDTADITPKGFKRYRGTDFADAAMSFENVGSKILSYTPLGALSNISYKSGAKVALRALENNKWDDTDLSLPNPFTEEEGEKRIGKDLTEWEKVALAKYLTVERPKNSIFESVSNWIGKAFGREVKEEKKDERFSKKLLEQLRGIKGISVDPKTGEVKYEGKDINKWLLDNRPKPREDIVLKDGTNLSRQFETAGVINYKGHNLYYYGDAGGTGSSRMDIFRVIGPDGKPKFYRRYEIEQDIATTGEDATENVIEWLINKASVDAGNTPVFPNTTDVVTEATGKKTPSLDYTDPTDPNNLYVEDRSDPPTDDYSIGNLGEFDTSPVTGPIQDPSEIPTPSPTPDYANPTLGLDPYAEREGPPDTGNPFSRPIQGDPIVEMGDFDQTDAVDPYAPIPMATSGKTADYMAGIKPTVTNPTVTPFDEKDRFPKVGPELDLSGIPSLQPDSLDAFGGAGPDVNIPDPVSSVDKSIQDAKENANRLRARAAEAARLEAQAKAARRRQEARDRDRVARFNALKATTTQGKAKEEAKKNPFADLSKFGGGRAKGGLAKMKTKPTAKRKGGLASKKK